MKKLAWRVERKKEIYALYQKLLNDVEQVQFIDTNLVDCSPWFIDILLENEKAKNDLMQYLNDQGIGTRTFYPPIHTQPPYAHLRGDFPNSEEISARGLWLPSSSFLTDDDIERICLEIRNFFRGKNL